MQGSLRDYLDILLLHAPDPLVEPEEVARAFDELHRLGKVRHFGVSNHNAMQIDLLKKTVRQPLVVNQISLGLANSLPIRGDSGFGGIVDYCQSAGHAGASLFSASSS
jgi:predicted oxidoreductase